MIFSKRVCSIGLVLLAMCAALMAQGPGSIRGQVLDQSGASVPKASVTVSGPNNVVKVATTDNDGNYAIPGLPAGKYTVRIIATGFNLLEKLGVDVPGGRPVTFDAHLILETSKQEVTVTDTQQVELDPAKNAGALVLKAEDLDMLSDDPDDLQADLLALAGPSAGPNGGQIFIDGFSNGQLPPKESIREIRINANPFSAEYDTQGRGRIEIFTKPGSEKFHGTVNLNYSDHLFNARNPFITSPDFAVPAADTKNLQANLSGPIIKTKMSFFIDFSRRQQRLDALINAVVLGPGFAPVSQGFAIIAPNTFDSISPRITYQLTPNISLDGRYSWRGQSYQNQGVGGFNLPNTADTQQNTNQTVNLIETQIVNASTINETRFQYFRQRQTQEGVDPELNIMVSDAFTTGSTFPLNRQFQDNYELQNYTSITHGAHFFKFGVRLREATENLYTTSNFLGQFNFDSISAYAIMQAGIAQGLSLPTIISQGGGPVQFQINSGNPQINGTQFDAGLFFQDDWKIKPNITLSLGMRYEVQQNIPDHGDYAPRVGLAWGIGPSQGRLRTPKTVLRAGFGYFYDRFSLANVLNAERFNGTNQLAYTITDPTFFPQAGVPVPPLSTIETPANAVASATYHIDPALQAPRLQQGAIGIDRQLPKNVTMSVMYINSRGTHVLRTVDINTPFPGTYFGPGTGVYPFGTAAGVYNEYQSDGIYKQNQLIFNSNARINSRISLFGYYAYGHVDTNVNGIPSNPYNFNSDYGRASYDIHHRININGSILAFYGIRLSPNITFNSSPPWNLVEGVDQFGDTSMPEMTGVEFLSHVRGDFPEAIRLLFTGYADIRAVIDAINQGNVYRYITKPWDPEELQTLIREAIERYDLLVERRRLVDMLQRKNAELEQANAELSRANTLKSAFIQVASHELRTPLTILLGLTELTTHMPAPANVQAGLGRIDQAGRRMQKLVDQIITMLSTGRFDQSLDRKPTELAPLLRESADDIRPFVELRSQHLTLDLPGNLGSLSLDGPKLRDSINHLLLNAIKFTPDGGNVALRARHDADGSATIEVSDTGTGIDEEAKARLFEPFFTGFDVAHHSSGHFEHMRKGIGLGLSIVRAWVEMHGGTIGVESKTGLGSTFTIHLPKSANPVAAKSASVHTTTPEK